MTNALQQAVQKIARLPESEQDHMGRQVLQHLEKLESLRDDVDHGLRELDAGEACSSTLTM